MTSHVEPCGGNRSSHRFNRRRERPIRCTQGHANSSSPWRCVNKILCARNILHGWPAKTSCGVSVQPVVHRCRERSRRTLGNGGYYRCNYRRTSGGNVRLPGRLGGIQESIFIDWPEGGINTTVGRGKTRTRTRCWAHFEGEGSRSKLVINVIIRSARGAIKDLRARAGTVTVVIAESEGKRPQLGIVSRSTTSAGRKQH